MQDSQLKMSGISRTHSETETFQNNQNSNEMEPEAGDLRRIRAIANNLCFSNPMKPPNPFQTPKKFPKNKNTLKQHKRQSSLKPEQLGHFIFGTKERYQTYLSSSKEKSSQNTQPSPAIHEQSRVDQISFNIKSSIKSAYNEAQGLIQDKGDYPYELFSNNFEEAPGFSGIIVAIPVIHQMGSGEQKRAWIPSIGKSVWTVAYARFELGHGSDLDLLGTSAVFDVKAQEFVINTNSEEEVKWIVEGGGVYATHCLMIANLYSLGKSYGPQVFFFQIRDLETFELFEGVDVGDIGPKLTTVTKDLGYMR